MNRIRDPANRYIHFQKSILNVSEDNYEQVKSNILESDYLTTTEKTDEFLHLFIECIDKRPRNVSFYLRITKDILSSNQYFMQILKEFLLSLNDRKTSRIHFLFMLYHQLQLISINDIISFILNLFQDKSYQYMRIHRKLTLSLFYWFSPEIKEKLTQQNQSKKFFSYLELLKSAHDSPYFKTLTDINVNFQNDYENLSANNFEKLKIYRQNGMSNDPIAHSISKDNLNEFIELSEKLAFNSKLNGTIQPSVFECCSFLNHHPTYLQYAAYHGSVNVFNYLIEKGADRTVCDHKKRRIEDYAIAGGCKEIIDTVFKLYFNDVSQNKIPNHEIQRHEEDHHSRHESSRRKRNNPFEIGAERTFTSCSNRVQKRFIQSSFKRQTQESTNDDDSDNSNSSNNSLLFAPPNEDEDDNKGTSLLVSNNDDDQSNTNDNDENVSYSNYMVAKFNRFGVIRPKADESVFFESCKADCLELVIFCLHNDKNRVDINSIDKNGTPAVSIACQYGNVDVVKYMSNLKSDEHQIDLSAQDQTGAPPIVRAASFGQLPVIRFLASRSTNENVGDVDINGADERGTTALVYASMKGYVRIVDFLIRQKNVDLNAMDEYYGPSFVHAAMHGHLDVIKLLATKEKSGLNMRGDYVSFAIIYAANHGYIDVIKYLLTKEDVDLNLKNIYDETVLTSAATGKQLDTIKFLVKLDGIDINQRGPNGNSALLAAASIGDLNIVKFLCNKEGVDVHLLNNYDANALDLAISNKNVEVVDYLKSIGLKKNKEQ